MLAHLLLPFVLMTVLFAPVALRRDAARSAGQSGGVDGALHRAGAGPLVDVYNQAWREGRPSSSSGAPTVLLSSL